jgi:hypothetical protein
VSHGGIQALRQGQWSNEQRQDGFRAGINDQLASVANQHYQRGYRLGQAARKRVRIQTTSTWEGNGFGIRTLHRAILEGSVVGEWCKDGLASNYAFEQRGATVASYKDWKKALVNHA